MNVFGLDDVSESYTTTKDPWAAELIDDVDQEPELVKDLGQEKEIQAYKDVFGRLGQEKETRTYKDVFGRLGQEPKEQSSTFGIWTVVIVGVAAFAAGYLLAKLTK